MSSRDNTEIVVADSHPLVAAGIRHILSDSFSLRTIRNKEALFDSVSTETPLLIIDYITLEDFAARDVLVLRERFPDLPVLVITCDEKKESILQVLESGVSGFLFKDCSEDEIQHAVGAITTGNKFYCNKVFDILMESRNSKDETDCLPTSLTKREISIVKLVVKGLPTLAIAKELHLSPHTVSTHRKNIMKKLQLRSPIELVTYAYDLGLIARPG